MEKTIYYEIYLPQLKLPITKIILWYYFIFFNLIFTQSERASLLPHPFSLPSTPPLTPSYESLFTAHYKNTYSSILSSSFTQTITIQGHLLIPKLSFRTNQFQYFITKMSSCSVTLLFLLLLVGPSSTLADPGRRRTVLEGHVRTEGWVQSGFKNKGGDKASGDSQKETEVGDTRAFKPGVPTEDGGEVWRELGAASDFRSTFSFSDGRLWEPRISSRCVPIPSGMALCQNIGYDTMRMPNLLGHDSPAEAVQQSASWLPLLARECHPDARIFLCSLFAPICLDRYVYQV